MSLDLLKAARDAQAALVEAAKARALDAHRNADDADRVAAGHVDVLGQLDKAVSAFVEHEAAVAELVKEANSLSATILTLAK